jgi:hypothetical protein
MSVQPTPKALMALTEFFIGYLYRSIHEDRQLRPLPYLREERLSVVRSGFNAKTHFNIIETLRVFLQPRINPAVKPTAMLLIKSLVITIDIEE